jgi:hypothetical protein
MAPGYEALDRTATDLAAPPRPQFDGLWRHAKDGQTRRGFVALLAIAAGPGTDEGLDVPHAFLVAQGVLYAAAAGVAMLAPARVGAALRVDPPLDDDELAMLPFVGMVLLVIAYMYAQGGRSNAAPAHFVAWSCAYRVLLVPLGTLGAYLLGGARPELCLTLGITEGVLGTLTCVAYSTAPLPPPALVIISVSRRPSHQLLPLLTLYCSRLGAGCASAGSAAPRCSTTAARRAHLRSSPSLARASARARCSARSRGAWAGSSSSKARATPARASS